MEKIISNDNVILFALANMNTYSFVAMGSKYDIMSSHNEKQDIASIAN